MYNPRLAHKASFRDKTVLTKNDTLSKTRILIVDNDPVMRLLMRESLPDDNYIITEAAGGHEALADIDKQIPDIVLLSILRCLT